MVNPVREHFEARARELEDCATIQVEEQEIGQLIHLTPVNQNAIGVRLSDDGDGTCEVWFDFNDGGEEIFEPEHVDYYIDAAVTGRVRRLQGPGRESLQVDDGKGYKTVESSWGLWPLFPIPGWRRRARVIHFDAYRTD